MNRSTQTVLFVAKPVRSQIGEGQGPRVRHEILVFEKIGEPIRALVQIAHGFRFLSCWDCRNHTPENGKNQAENYTE